MWNKYFLHLKALIHENRVNHKVSKLGIRELEWAMVYRDSIRGVEFLEKLSLNVGRWAVGYPFLYVLHRILNDYQPKQILEFGLGESTKLINAYLNNVLLDSSHLIIEQSPEWDLSFRNRVTLSERSIVKLLPVKEITINGGKSFCYEGIERVVDKGFNLYVVDGPRRSEDCSRFDIVRVTEHLNRDDKFIILLDDYNRKGEQDTYQYLLKQFKAKGIPVVGATYQGNKTVAVMASEHYKYITTL